VLERIHSNQRINFLSLVTMQGANALIPLFVFPYLLTTLGAESFSQLVISETLSIIILAFVLFGFDIISVKKLTNATSVSEESDIFFSVLYSRLAIFLLLLPVSVPVLIIFDWKVLQLYLLWILVPLGHILQSAYFYLYKQSNFILAITTLCSRIAGLILVLYLIKGPGDVFNVPLILGGTYIVGSLLSFIFAISYWQLEIKLPVFKKIWSDFYEGTSYFISNVSVLLYRDLNVLILSLVFKDPNAISIYALAEKIVKSAQAVFRPISQFYFPKTVVALRGYTLPSPGSLKVVWMFTYKQLVLFSLFFIVGMFAIFSFEKEIISLVSLPVFEALVFSMPMMLVIYIAIPNYMLGMVGLNNLGCERYLAKVILMTGAFNIFSCFLLAKMIGALGAAICFVISEFLLLVLILKKYKYTVNHVE